jgi:hypothetical protein
VNDWCDRRVAVDPTSGFFLWTHDGKQTTRVRDAAWWPPCSNGQVVVVVGDVTYELVPLRVVVLAMVDRLLALRD